MRFRSKSTAGILASLVFLAAKDTAAQGAGRPGWYVSVGAGPNRTGVLKQAGFNRDAICYPTNICPRTPDGYRWTYDLDAQPGTAFALATGRSVNAFRLEISVSGDTGDIEETFTGIAYYDGTPVRPDPDSDFANTAETAVDGFSTQALSLSVYRDFPGAFPGIEPYVGIGVGLSRVELSGLYFRSEYTCVRAPCAGRRAAHYNSHQNADLTDTVRSGQVHAGVDYPLAGDRYALGLKLSYRVAGDLEARAGYLTHPVPDEMNTTRISGINRLSLTLQLKYRLGARSGT